MKNNLLDIAINAVFLEEQSIVEENIFLWAYHIRIINMCDQALTIKKRVFEVVDCIGQRQTIEGVGVLDDQPVVLSSEMFEYASGVLLSQPSGFFSGYYVVELENNSICQALIPSFSLDSKYDLSKSQ